MAIISSKAHIRQVLSTFNGIVPFYKERGQFGHHVINWFRRTVEHETGLMSKKIGLHFRCTYPIEPFGAGVILVGFGGQSRHLKYQRYLPMKYEVVAELGKLTDSYSVLGKLLDQKQYDFVTVDQIEKVCRKMKGEIQLTTPKPFREPEMEPYEDERRIKYEIQQRFQQRREGLAEQRFPRLCHMESIELVDFCSPYVKLRVDCQGSCFVRSLVHELGLRLGTFAMTLDLERLSIENFDENVCLKKSDVYWEYIQPKARWCSHEFIKSVKRFQEEDPLPLNYRIL